VTWGVFNYHTVWNTSINIYHIYGDVKNYGCIKDDGNHQPDQTIYQELFGTLSFKRSRGEIPGEKKKSGHEVRLIDGIEEE
jgi:hypothetical protein